MTMKDLCAMMGLTAVLVNVACSEVRSPLTPSNPPNTEISTATTASTTDAQPVVTLLSDLTASPSLVTVKAGYRVKMVNQSGRYARIHSYNCSEFNMMQLPNGGWLNTSEFTPAGKTCDYFKWDVNWSRQIFVGQVVVE
jgi:hypothetical protein